MSLLGKILVAFNLLAVLLFLYLVAVDWGVRQTWAYAANRWDLALDGLPLDSEERGPEGDRLIERSLRTH